MPIFSTPAFPWNGTLQLPGHLELGKTNVLFLLTDFHESHLNLSIPIKTIKKIDEFLVFDLARNGLRIHNKNGQSDLFILENLKEFKTILIQTLNATP